MKKFRIEDILKKAFQNTDMKQGDKGTFGNTTSWTYKKFDTLQSLLNTLPKISFKALHQFIDKHEIFLPKVCPPGFNQAKDSFDLND